MGNSSARVVQLAILLTALAAPLGVTRADGIVVPLQQYQGSLAEAAQEAILFFQPGSATESATEDLILKIQVEGDTSSFAWVVPLPSVPSVEREDPALFEDFIAMSRPASRNDTERLRAPIPTPRPSPPSKLLGSM